MKPDITNLHINGNRLWKSLQALSAIGEGREEHSGVSRLAFTPEDMEARKWLLNQFIKAGLDGAIDHFGNVTGEYRPPGHNGSCRRAIILGSHTDTVPQGGMFDGALGVLAGLECARIIAENRVPLNHPLQVVSFSNEEGSRLGPGMFGSRAFFQGIPQEEWDSVAPVLKRAGLFAAVPPTIPPAPRPVADYAGYLELHVEQGEVLDRGGFDIGVVQGIVCIHRFSATFVGMANHAGTTPMEFRKDALLGAARLALLVPEMVSDFGSGASVGTCGQISVLPGGSNIIPGQADLSVEVRDLDDEVARRIVSALRRGAGKIAAEMNLEVRLSQVDEIGSAAMDERIQDTVEKSAKEMSFRALRMPSGAGHDCMIAAGLLPSGMVFVPSKGGISHSPKEWTDKEQCARGADVLLRTLLRLDAIL